MGLELARILYSKNAKVYIAAREVGNAIATTKKAEPASKGELVFLHLDFADLNSVKAPAEQFLSAEKRLLVLFNNAGYMLKWLQMTRSWKEQRKATRYSSA